MTWLSEHRPEILSLVELRQSWVDSRTEELEAFILGNGCVDGDWASGLLIYVRDNRVPYYESTDIRSFMTQIRIDILKVIAQLVQVFYAEQCEETWQRMLMEQASELRDEVFMTDFELETALIEWKEKE